MHDVVGEAARSVMVSSGDRGVMGSGESGPEGDDPPVLSFVADFDGVAADFAVLDVALIASRQIQQD